jgi:hypothetical protein
MFNTMWFARFIYLERGRGLHDPKPTWNNTRAYMSYSSDLINNPEPTNTYESHVHSKKHREFLVIKDAYWSFLSIKGFPRFN